MLPLSFTLNCGLILRPGVSLNLYKLVKPFLVKIKVCASILAKVCAYFTKSSRVIASPALPLNCPFANSPTFPSKAVIPMSSGSDE